MNDNAPENISFIIRINALKHTMDNSVLSYNATPGTILPIRLGEHLTH